MIIQGKYLYSGNDLSDVFKVREEVMKEYSKTKNQTINYSEYDDLSIHGIVYAIDNNKCPVATGKIYFNGDIFKVDNIYVMEKYRRRKYGDFLVKMLINKAFLSGANEVYIESPDELTSFFYNIGFFNTGNERLINNQTFYEMKVTPSKVCRDCINS